MSLIIPIYNSNYIDIQLKSIYNVILNYALDLEIFFIDDWSDMSHQNSYELSFKNYSNLNITYYHLWEKCWQNRVVLARNKWVELAKSDFLIFIDQETILSKDYISNILKYCDSDDIIIWPYLWYNDLEKSINETDIDFFINNWYINKDNFSDFRIDFYKEKLLEYRIWEFFCASNFFIKKDIYLKIWWFDESLTNWWDEDVEFWYRLYKSWYKIIFDEKLYVLNLSDKLYNKPFKILEENKIKSLSNNWLKNYEKHKTPDYKRYIYDRYNHLEKDLKTRISKNFKYKFINKKNILIHSINWIWLGHIKRTLLIASEIFKSNEIWDIIFVTNSKNPFLLKNAWFKVVYLDYGIEDCLKSISFEEYENNNFSTINKIISDNNIDILIHDTYFIKKVLDNRPDISHFLILRDSEIDYLNSINNYLNSFKKILIPHIKEEISIDKQDFYNDYKNIIYTGYVFEDIKINEYKSKNIIVSPWYGWDYENTKIFFSYINELIKSNLYLFKQFEITFILWKYFDELIHDLQFCDILKLLKFDENLQKSIANCELFIWRWWYNTLNEVSFTSTKSILFPVDRNAENQDNRIDFFINHFQLDFLKKGSYYKIVDLENIEGYLSNHSTIGHSFWKSEKVSGKINDFQDWKKIISDEIIKQINKKNILVFKHIFLPKSENFIYEELRLLEIFNPIIFTLKNDNMDSFQNDFNIYYFSEFEKLLSFDYPKIENNDLYLKLLKYLVYLIRKHDIKVIYTEFLFDSYFIIKIKTLLPEIKIISAARGFDAYSFLKNKIINQKQFLDKLNRILVRDSTMKSEITKYWINTENVEVVRSVVDFSKYSFVKKDFKKLDIIFWWRFVEKKGLIELLDLIALLVKQDFVWKILLFWDGELKSEILEKIDNLWISTKIEYIGFLEHKDLLKQINNYNCYINYSKVSENGDSDWVPNLLFENILSWNLIFTRLAWGIGELIKDMKTWIILSWDINNDLLKIENVFYKVRLPDMAIAWCLLINKSFWKKQSIEKLKNIINFYI